MKKTTFAILFVLLMSVQFAYTQDREINFDHSPFKELQAKAAKENKLIFIDCYTRWCGPCKLMAKSTFKQNDVADYYNATFINAKIDMEKGEGVDIRKKYDITGFPSFLFLNAKGEVIHRGIGYKEAPNFIAFGKTAFSDSSFSAMAQKFKKGNCSQEFVEKYFTMCSNLGINVMKIVTDYVDKSPKFTMYTPEKWNLITTFGVPYKSKTFNNILLNKKKLEQKFSAADVDGVLKDCYSQELRNANNKEKTDKGASLNNVYAQIMKNVKNPDSLVLANKIKMATSKDNYKLALTTLKKFLSLKSVNTSNSTTINFTNALLWGLVENNVTDKSLLAMALDCGKVLDNSNDGAAIDTYANLLFMNGEKEKAISREEKAIELAKAIPNIPQEEIESLEKTLEKFKGN